MTIICEHEISIKKSDTNFDFKVIFLLYFHRWVITENDVEIIYLTACLELLAENSREYIVQYPGPKQNSEPAA